MKWPWSRFRSQATAPDPPVNPLRPILSPLNLTTYITGSGKPAKELAEALGIPSGLLWKSIQLSIDVNQAISATVSFYVDLDRVEAFKLVAQKYKLTMVDPVEVDPDSTDE